MNRKNCTKQKYVCPDIGIVHTTLDYLLLETSFHNGGHKDAGNDGPGLNAKPGWLDEDEEENLGMDRSECRNIWND